MAGSVIVNGARTPMGRLLGSLKDFSGADLGGGCDQGRAGAFRGAARPGAVRDHGPGAAGRRRPDPGPAGRAQGGHPAERAGADRQQGVPVRPGRDRAGRPAHPGRRVRHHRRRRPGVDDQRPAPAAQVARRLQVRLDRGARRDGLRRADRHLRQHPDGRVHRPVQREARPRPRGAGRVRRAVAPARRGRAEERRVRRRDHRRSRSRSARATRSKFREDEGIRADTTVESPGQAAAGVHQGRHDHRRVAPRRSPTVPPRSSS